MSYRLVNHNTLQVLRETIINKNLSYIEGITDCNNAIIHLHNDIQEAYDLCCPIITKSVSPKSLSKPWINNSIQQHIKRRDNLFKLKCQGVITKDSYNRFRNFVTNLIRTAKAQYFNAKFKQFENDISQTWKTINDILRPGGSNKTSSVKKLIINDTIYDNETDIAQQFNSFFTNIGKNIADEIPDSHTDIHQYLKGNFLNSFYFTPVTQNEVSRLIISLKNKSGHIESYNNKILKYLSTEIAPILASIINNSFTSGIFPDSLKLAKVIPIHKEGDPTNLNNYRPISILPPLSKIIERAVYGQIYKYLEQKDILIKQQFGFRKNKSTVQAITDKLKYIYENLDSDRIVFSLFLDFRKAFDSLNHSLLLQKLHYYGFRGTVHNWFKSYLSNRKQFIQLNNITSDQQLITHGVPQGSILGPLLFFIFINDLPNASNLFKYTLFADDSTLSTTFPPNSRHTICNSINQELNNINSWLVTNKICINSSKTKYIVFSYGRNIDLPLIKIGNHKISATDNVKFLGIHLDPHLTFEHHIKYISNKIAKSVGILYKLNYYLPLNILKTLYTTMIQPYLLYGIEAYYGTYQTLTNKLFILQKKSVRAINKLPYNEHTNLAFKNMGILKLKDLFTYQIATFMYKTIYMSQNPDLSNELLRNQDVHSYETRQRNKLILPRITKHRSKNSILYQGVSVWNSIPVNVHENVSLSKFKNKLKENIISSY